MTPRFVFVVILLLYKTDVISSSDSECSSDDALKQIESLSALLEEKEHEISSFNQRLSEQHKHCQDTMLNMAQQQEQEMRRCKEEANKSGKQLKKYNQQMDKLKLMLEEKEDAVRRLQRQATELKKENENLKIKFKRLERDSIKVNIVGIICIHIAVPSQILNGDIDDTSYQTPYPSNVELLSELNRNEMDQCDATAAHIHDIPLDPCHALEQRLNNTQKELLFSQHEHQQANKSLAVCKQQSQALELRLDHYDYGQLDALQREIEALKRDKKQQCDRIIELERKNAVYEEADPKHKQRIQRLEETKESQSNQINAQTQRIQKLLSENAKYAERYHDMQKDYEMLKKGFSLHENAKLRKTMNTMNKTLKQCTVHLKDSKLQSGQISHELGECNVEWGSCDQQYAQCTSATLSLQQQIAQQKEKFALCSKVSKTCKKERKELKNDLKSLQNQVFECGQSLSNNVEDVLVKYCWARQEDKQSFYIGCALCVFALGVMAFVIWFLVNNVLSEQGMEHYVEQNELHQRMLSEKDRMQKEYEAKLKEKEKEIDFVLQQISQQNVENKEVDIVNKNESDPQNEREQNK